MDIPKLSQEVVHSVDATPDEGYPIRILRAYLANAECHYELSGPDVTEAEKGFWELLNDHQRERAAILKRAIEILEEHTSLPTDPA